MKPLVNLRNSLPKYLCLIGAGVVSFLYGQNVGIGTAAPSERLDVAGNVRFSGALMPAGDPGAIGQVLVSQGATTAPVWRYPHQIAPGWRLIYVDDFDDGTVQGWSGAGTSTCGSWRLLGGYNQCGSSCVLTKTYALTGIPHTRVRVVVYWVRIDSWDQNNTNGRDYWELRLDNTTVSMGAAVGSSPGSGQGSLSICGQNGNDEVWAEEGPFVTSGSISHTANSVKVDIVSFLNEAASNESLGIDAVEVWVY